jgi:ABC-type molybdate transport system ATPase subunit
MSGAARRGDAVELAVNASDVVLALTPASTVLACARLEARILDLEGLRSFETLVRLAADGVELEALVSTAVIEAEGLQAGRTVVALIRQAHCRLAPSSSKGA